MTGKDCKQKKVINVKMRNLTPFFLFCFLFLIFFIYWYWVISTPCDPLKVRSKIGNHELCVPAAIAKVMNFWGVPISFNEIALKMSQAGNFKTEKVNKQQWLIAAANGIPEHYNMKFMYCIGTFKDLKKLLSLGIPPILHLFYDDCAHVMVLTGYRYFFEYYTFDDSDTGDYIILSKKELQQKWKYQNFEYLIIAPSKKIPPWCKENKSFREFMNSRLYYSKYLDKYYHSSLSDLLIKMKTFKEKISNIEPYSSLYESFVHDLKGETSETINSLEKICLNYSHYELVQYFLAGYYLESGKKRKGLEILKAFHKRHPNSYKARNLANKYHLWDEVYKK